MPQIGLLLLALFVAPALFAGQDEPTEQVQVQRHPSARNASYTIEVTLDPEAKTLQGKETITWTNIQPIATDELRLHLYWNAWRNNRSTWLLESRLRARGRNRRDPQEGDFSYSDVTSIKLIPDIGLPSIDVTRVVRYDAPDDGNPEDRTLMVVPLPEPVEPLGTAQIELEWSAAIPRTFARTGFRGNFFFLAQWFPKLAVLEAGGWNAHQFHAGTEFYSDYGEYDVRITVPSDYVVGATGREVDTSVHDDGTTTHRYRQADVHDFAWTTSPDYLVLEKAFNEPPLPPVAMRLLLQPEHEGQAERHFHATAAALRNYGTWYGAYPYGHVTIVDPAYGSGAGGMEYPTFFTAGTRLFNPFGGGSPEGVTVHECGHQFWYGLVGNNEFEHAWLDEGFNTFSTARTMDVTYGNRTLVKRYMNPRGARRMGGFLPVFFEGVESDRMVGGNRLDGYRTAATSDAQSTPTYLYSAGGGAHSYNKTALWLSTLERYLGWDTLQPIMATFFERYKYRHPSPQDFFDVANEVSGRDLTWFFDQVYRSSNDFDYAIERATSDPIEISGYVKDSETETETKDERLVHRDSETELFRTEVIVRRNGAAHFPVDVLMVFEDGSEVRESWDGQDRFKLCVEERPQKLSYAVVDPERKLLLDLYYTNNSKLLEPRGTLPARKWSSKWMIWFQDLLATFAFFS